VNEVSPIHDVRVIPLRTIPDARGMVMHMLRRDDPHFTQFGEIYFSLVHPGAVKGWHLHTVMTLNYAVVVGQIRLVIYDDRDHSPTRGALHEMLLGEARYHLVQIPPGLWNGFQGVGLERAIVANCSTHPHDPQEIRRIEPFDYHIPYRWATDAP